MKAMKKLRWVVVALLLFAVGCSAPTPESMRRDQDTVVLLPPESAEDSASIEELEDSVSMEEPVSVEESILDVTAGMFTDVININILGDGVQAYDTDTPEYMAYYHDYIFTATILNVGERYDPYFEPEYVEKYGSAMIYNPCYTKYQLQVTGCIKGDLQAGDIIQGRKIGYFDEETQEYYMLGGDVMPEEGKEYLILANNRMDDNVFAFSGPNSVFPLEQETSPISTYRTLTENPDRNGMIERYVEAYENERPDPDGPAY